MRRAADRRRVLEQDLRDAIGRDELVLHFQPIVGTQSGDVEGYEALVRWERPGIGLLPPDEFLPIAEESGLIDAVDAWVLDRAAGQLARWRSVRRRSAVHLGQPLARHVARPHVVDSVAAALDDWGADPALLVLETGEAALPTSAAPSRTFGASGSWGSASASTTSAPASAHCRDSPTCRSTS